MSHESWSYNVYKRPSQSTIDESSGGNGSGSTSRLILFSTF